ncbi:MAG TPA: hydroxymethylglutaryl-CoA lyase [Thermoanaerobaculia bacterium]|jgi:hydroxymethylglutaryl-CoA lyase|nr:hydroxymethylglutaryl-CoA lyase [Thermoanaerobaculia bacterium]
MEPWEEHAIRRPNLPPRVAVYEVGPRDGLQNEPETLSVEARAEFVDLLTESGLQAIEVGSFVSPAAIPQLADTEEVYRRIHRGSGTRYPALVPNLRGLERAMAAGVREIAVFTAASETFNQHNIHAGIDESIERFRPVVTRAQEEKIRVRGYVSTAFGCPYEGAVSPDAVREVVHKLLDLPVDEISLGDTIGVATPSGVYEVVEALYESGVARGVLALHFHDTRGTALANVYAGLECGIATFDAAAGGLGGCPYAPGAAGNVATEDVLYLLDGLGIETGVSLAKVVVASRALAKTLGRRPPGRYLGAVWGAEA